MVNKPQIKSDVLRKLQDVRRKRDAEDLDRRIKRTIGHIDEISELGSETFKRRNAVLDAARTGNDPEINHLAAKKAAVSDVNPTKNVECKDGICRIIRPRKK